MKSKATGRRKRRANSLEYQSLERRQLLASDIGVIGTAQVDHNWTTINLNQSFTDPVVVTGALSSNETDPATVRIRSVTANSFEIQIDEWDYLDGAHASEQVSYAVVEAGYYELENGSLLVAGNLLNQTEAWVGHSLAIDLNNPIVFANAIASDGGEW